MSMYEYANKYNAENYYKVALRIPIAKKDVLKNLAKLNGKSVNRIIIEAIERQYGVDLSK